MSDKIEPHRLEGLLSGLGNLLDDEAGLVRDPDLLARYSSDWTQKHPTLPVAVARPRSTAEVSAILAYCHAAGWPIVVQGGLTGLSGGATPQPGELALSLERLSGIEELNPVSGHIIVKAGTTLAAVHEAAAEHGMMFALDLAASGSCTIGGNIATNAGGNRVLRYGMTRNLVLGLEVVLADGRVLSSLNAMLKDNAGYDLKQLFIGAEGTLGVITRAVLRLHPAPSERMSVLIALDAFADMTALLATLRAELGSALCAFEAMWSSYFECALSNLELSRPFAEPHPYYALVEFELLDPSRDREFVETCLYRVIEDGKAANAMVAGSLAETARVWRIREAAGELLQRLSPAISYDVSLPLSHIDEFVAVVTARCQGILDGRPLCAFGHVADGGLHLLAPLPSLTYAAAIDTIVYEALGAHGSVSAEHGIGTSKRSWLGVTRTPTEIAVMRGIKQHLDPQAILNPRRII